eukprot:GILK01010622.1.p1 GENE.GILK01010622.1~~GILK01010622.1.p1  ORF type:complete len:759 (-),score=146.95 GILK01010622.1:333-2609(-)
MSEADKRIIMNADNNTRNAQSSWKGGKRDRPKPDSALARKNSSGKRSSQPRGKATNSSWHNRESPSPGAKLNATASVFVPQGKQDPNYAPSDASELSTTPDEYFADLLLEEDIFSNRRLAHSKKGVRIANHLLNFSFEHKTGTPFGTSSKRRSKFEPYNRERFLQANFRFLVRDSGDYGLHLVDPDRIVDWIDIEQVALSAPSPVTCPICLEPPVAAKITKCGHIFCWHCILQYLSYGTRQWRRCPLCFDPVGSKDLKSVTVSVTPRIKEGDRVTLGMMNRLKGSVVPWQRSRGKIRYKESELPLSTDPDVLFSRFSVLVNPLSIAIADRNDLESLLALTHSSGEVDLVPFISQALDLSKERISKLESTGLVNQVSPPTTVAASVAPVRTAAASSDAFFDLEEEESANVKQPIEERKEEENFDDDDEIKRNRSLTTPVTTNVSNQAKPKRGSVNRKHSLSSLNEEDEVNSDGEDGTYSFYQSVDGQLLFLHPLNVRMLMKEYGRYSRFPNTIEGEVIEIEHCQQTDHTRKRFKYLSHLPLAADFLFVELDMTSLVSTDTNKLFADEVRQRRNRRTRRRREEDLAKDQSEQLNYVKQVAMMEDITSWPSMESLPVEFLNSGLVDVEVTDATVASSPPETTSAPKSSFSKIVKGKTREEEYPSLGAAAPVTTTGSVTSSSPPSWNWKQRSTTPLAPTVTAATPNYNYNNHINHNASEDEHEVTDIGPVVGLREGNITNANTQKTKKGKKMFLSNVSLRRY